MILKVFTIYDCKAEAYMNPFFDSASGSAIRSFERAVNDPQSDFSHSYADFTLFQIGEYDNLDGSITMLDARINLGNGVDFRQS